MRTLITILLLLPVYTFSQDILPKNSDGKFEFSEVVTVDSASAEKLYSNAKIFIVDAFKSGKDVTQLNDDASKTVIGKGTTKIILKVFGGDVTTYVRFTVTIQCKENRYRYMINDFLYYNTTDGRSTITLDDHSYFGKNKQAKKFHISIQQQLDETIKQMIELLKKTMAGKTASTKDW